MQDDLRSIAAQAKLDATDLMTIPRNHDGGSAMYQLSTIAHEDTG